MINIGYRIKKLIPILYCSHCKKKTHHNYYYTRRRQSFIIMIPRIIKGELK
jgi:hypothetical protein